MKNLFLTYFSSYTDIHLFKDPGQVPYRFQKVLGYESYIITLQSSEYLKETKKYLNVFILPQNKISRYFKLIKFILKNRKRIKVFNIFHIAFHNIFVAWLCKLFIPNLFIYLKMDNCLYTGPYPWEKIFDQNIKHNRIFDDTNERMKTKLNNYILKKYLIKKVNLFSVEDKDSRNYYENKYPFFKDNIVTIYNGHVVDLFESKYLENNYYKENIVLNVGNIGTYSKATDILLESFAKISHKNKWDLHLAGDIDDSFKPYLQSYFKRFPELRGRIIFHGHLNKIKLFELYSKAKIFCLPSRFEGFAIVYPEAMFFKNAIITTRDVSPRKIIENKMGLIVEKDDVDQLARAMQYLIERPGLIEKYAENAHNFAKENLHWDIIIKNLFCEMEKRGFVIQ